MGKEDIERSFEDFAGYANFVSRASLFRERLEEAGQEMGFEIVGLPKYVFPQITLASPEFFEGEKLLRSFLLDSLQGKIAEQKPSYVSVWFKDPFYHPFDGTTRSGFTWAINRKEDTLEMLKKQLDRKNPITYGLDLAWGENPHSLDREIAEATVFLSNPAWCKIEYPDYPLDPVDTENNAVEFAKKVEEKGIKDWFEWAHIIYIKSESPLFAHLALDLARRAKKCTPVAAMMYIEDFWEDTYDKRNGDILMPSDLETMEASELVDLSCEMIKRFDGLRSHEYY